MKFAILLALAAAAIAYPQAQDSARAAEGHVVVPGGMAPEVQKLKPRFNQFYNGVQRSKIRYGKYTLPKASDISLMSMLTGEAGMMSTIAIGMKKPCDTCSLVAARAGLEYANGTEATTASGSWLHHIVMLATGSGRRDSVCGIWPGERFFSSGNERTQTAFGDVVEGKVKAAFPISPADGIQAQLELMNMDDRVKDVWVTIDYEFIPGPKPKDYKTAKAIWLDVTNCGISSVSPPRNQKQFTLSMNQWTSPWNGQMLGVGGHLHDGGTHLEVIVNNKVICDSIAKYAEGGPGGMNMKVRRDGPHTGGGAHIGEMTTCSLMGALNRGDRVTIKAYYDFNKYKPMESDGGAPVAVMGIAIMYAAVDL